MHVEYSPWYVTDYKGRDNQQEDYRESIFLASTSPANGHINLEVEDEDSKHGTNTKEK